MKIKRLPLLPSRHKPTDKVSPFLTEPLPQGAPQGQQQSFTTKVN